MKHFRVIYYSGNGLAEDFVDADTLYEGEHPNSLAFHTEGHASDLYFNVIKVNQLSEEELQKAKSASATQPI